VEKAGIDVVPRTLIVNGQNGSGTGTNGGYSAFDALMTLLLSERLAETAKQNGNGPSEINAEVRRIRESILRDLSASSAAVATPGNGQSAPAAPSNGGKSS
jgi:hypothetical protein